MSEPFLGEIKMVAFTFAPIGWAFCNGTILSIQQNTALFALLGTTYGGNGINTFALPDLRGRVPVHFGQGPGLSQFVQGQTGGAEVVTLLQSQMPAHGHLLSASSAAGTTRLPGGAGLAKEAAGQTAVYNSATLDTQMNPASVGNAGGGQPHENFQPYLAVNFIIALQGIFPSRS